MNNWDINEIFTALNLKNNFKKKVKIKKVVIDSKQVSKGDLFVAIKGKKFDGHNFIEEAVQKGANAIISEGSRLTKQIPIISVKNQNTDCQLM